MPTYEYACQSCGTHVEVYQRFNDEPLTECGLCRGPLRKVFHPAGILFKGSGFYVTDSRSGRAGKGAGGSSSESKSRGSEETSKSKESKESKTSTGSADSSPAAKPAPTKEASA